MEEIDRLKETNESLIQLLETIDVLTANRGRKGVRLTSESVLIKASEMLLERIKNEKNSGFSK